MINFLHLQSISTCLTFLSLQFERKYPDENSYSVLIRGGGGGGQFKQDDLRLFYNSVLCRVLGSNFQRECHYYSERLYLPLPGDYEVPH